MIWPTRSESRDQSWIHWPGSKPSVMIGRYVHEPVSRDNVPACLYWPTGRNSSSSLPDQGRLHGRMSLSFVFGNQLGGTRSATPVAVSITVDYGLIRKDWIVAENIRAFLDVQGLQDVQVEFERGQLLPQVARWFHERPFSKAESTGGKWHSMVYGFPIKDWDWNPHWCSSAELVSKVLVQLAITIRTKDDETHFTRHRTRMFLSSAGVNHSHWCASTHGRFVG